jgi:hypothetical protein
VRERGIESGEVVTDQLHPTKELAPAFDGGFGPRGGMVRKRLHGEGRDRGLRHRRQRCSAEVGGFRPKTAGYSSCCARANPRFSSSVGRDERPGREWIPVEIRDAGLPKRVRSLDPQRCNDLRGMPRRTKSIAAANELLELALERQSREDAQRECTSNEVVVLRPPVHLGPPERRSDVALEASLGAIGDRRVPTLGAEGLHRHCGPTVMHFADREASLRARVDGERDRTVRVDD